MSKQQGMAQQSVLGKIMKLFSIRLKLFTDNKSFFPPLCVQIWIL